MHYFRFHLKFIRATILILLYAVLQACAVSPVNQQDSLTVVEQEKVPVKVYPEFGESPLLLEESDIFYLPPERTKAFLKYYNHHNNKNTSKNRRISNYLQKIVSGFNYHSATYIASESAEFNQGNCLSLAILTTALARLTDVTVGYELMQTPPIYQKKGNTILSSQHVRSLLYYPTHSDDEGFFWVFRPVLKVDYFPTFNTHVKRRVDESEFVSMYYRNKAAEAIIDKKYVDAFWLAKKSFEYAENNAHATNMLALIYSHMGYKEDSEKLYLYGIKYADEKLELLSNYQKFLERNGRIAEALSMQEQIDQYKEPDPFEWIELGDEAIALGDINEAVKYYDKAIELAPYLHEGYSGKGKAEYLRGNPLTAQKAFKKAEELAFEKDTKAMYEAKLSALTKYTQN